MPAVARYRHQLFERGFGKSAADALTPQQHMNVGIFAARAESALWRPWAEAYQEALNRSAGAMFSEQVALNFACYHHHMTVELLQAIYNWQCHLAVTSWNPASQLFCEPHLPNAPISLVHMSHT